MAIKLLEVVDLIPGSIDNYKSIPGRTNQANVTIFGETNCWQYTCNAMALIQCWHVSKFYSCNPIDFDNIS